MCLPACRIIQTGLRSTDSPRAALSSRGSGDADDPIACDTSIEETHSDKISIEIMVDDRNNSGSFDLAHAG